MGFAAYFLPYFLLPATFKFAGGALRQIGGFVNDRHRGGFDRLRQFRANTAKRRGQDLAAGKLLNDDTINPLYNAYASRFNRASTGAANLKNAGYNPIRMRSRMTAARGQDMMAQATKALNENEIVKSALGDDDIAEAMLSGRESYVGSGNYGGNDDGHVRQFLKDRGYKGEMLENKVALARQARHQLAPNIRELTAWLGDMGTHTGFDEKEVTDANGVVHRTAGAGDSIKTLNSIVGDNDDARIRAISAGRDLAMNKGRVDMAGMGFSEEVQLARDSYGPGKSMTVDQITETMRNGAMNGQSRGSLIGRSPRALRNLVPAMQSNFDQIVTGGNEQQLMQELAMAGAGQQVASQVSMENAVEHAKYMNHEINLSVLPNIKDGQVRRTIEAAAEVKRRTVGGPINTVTVQDLLDVNRGNRELTATTFQYGNQMAADAASVGRNPGPTTGTPTPPITPPTTPPTGT
jgi:hypothetical protein